jgi:hypothetical protein
MSRKSQEPCAPTHVRAPNYSLEVSASLALTLDRMGSSLSPKRPILRGTWFHSWGKNKTAPSSRKAGSVGSSKQGSLIRSQSLSATRRAQMRTAGVAVA